MTRVLIAPDSFGGWISATEFCARTAKLLDCRTGLSSCRLPLADGGEGTTDCLLAHFDAPVRTTLLTDVRGMTRSVRSLALEDGLFFESAQAIGLPAGHGSGNPLHWTTAPLGEWMSRWSPHPQIIGLGGSSTVDGGIGTLRALGLEVRDERGAPVAPGALGLLDARSITGDRPALGPVEIWCDVRTTAVESVLQYGPQKGLEPSWIESLSEGMNRWSKILCDFAKQRVDTELSSEVEGGGAAGGLGLALAALTGSPLGSGFSALAQRIGLRDHLEKSDWVICGEGRLDTGSFYGKPVGELIGLARKHSCGVIAVVGQARDVPRPPVGPDIVIEVGWEPSPDEALIRSIERLCGVMGWV